MVQEIPLMTLTECVCAICNMCLAGKVDKNGLVGLSLYNKDDKIIGKKNMNALNFNGT